MRLLMRRIVSIAAVLLVIAGGESCSSGPTLPKDYRGEQLHFGTGGGFSGAVNYFILLDDGRMYTRIADTTDTYLTTLRTALTRQLFSHYHTTGLDKRNFNEPGNIYRFIGLHADGGQVNRMTWGADEFTPPSGLAEYHLLLMQSTKPRS